MLESEKIKIKGFTLNNHNNIKYLGETLNEIEESDYVVVKKQGLSLKNDIRYIYCLYYSFLKINPMLLVDAAKNNFMNFSKKILDYKFFSEVDKKKQISNNLFEKYFIKNDQDISVLYKLCLGNILFLILENNLPLKGYKIYIHPSISVNYNEIDEIKKNTMGRIIVLLGASLVNHIRLCDICIINSLDSGTYVPPHVIQLNQVFLYDILNNFKLPEITNFQYQPQDKRNRRLRK